MTLGKLLKHNITYEQYSLVRGNNIILVWFIYNINCFRIFKQIQADVKQIKNGGSQRRTGWSALEN